MTFPVISPAALSVIVQGPVVGGPERPGHERLTWRAIESVRRAFPGAEVILSTWNDSDIRGLAPDITVISADPGAFTCRRPGLEDYVNGVNRSIVSTLAGLRAAARPYAVKLRSDCEMIHDGLLAHWQVHAERCDEMRVFSDRIICGELFSRDPYITSFLFHPSDVFHFGRTNDLLRLWDVPLAAAADTERWRDSCFNRPWVISEGLPIRYVPAQYLWITALNKAGHEFSLDHCMQMPRSIVGASEMSLLNNFSLIDERSLGLAFPAAFLRASTDATYTRRTWQKLYEMYCVRRNRGEIEKRSRRVAARALLRKTRYVLENMAWKS